MITIYHNPRCAKSRQGLAIVEESGKEFQVVKYLEEPLSESQLKTIVKQLQCKPIDLVRINEPIWKEKYKGKTLTDDAVIKAMANYPKLIERPIVVNKDKAVIGRPPEKIQHIL
ncbi:MAG TPA: arsenate reductase (glutaredoxin) [Flavobacteriaceae bacterium]|nr:arsenate reductase (glutaredoxin) [Flavobacteriaceae bacterium]